MVAGVASGLQNQFEGLVASQVGSIPTYSRHFVFNKSYKLALVFVFEIVLGNSV